MIGLSVSLCISEMAQGKVDPSQVERIIAGTAADGPEAWNDVIEIYRRDYWHGFADKAEELLRRFLGEGKISQPRLEGSQFPDRDEGIWVESEEEIVWRR